MKAKLVMTPKGWGYAVMNGKWQVKTVRVEGFREVEQWGTKTAARNAANSRHTNLKWE